MYFIILILVCDNDRLFCDNAGRFGDNGGLWVTRIPRVDHEFTNQYRLATIGSILEILEALNSIVCVRSGFNAFLCDF